jgi:UPF0716 protein FxsA
VSHPGSAPSGGRERRGRVLRWVFVALLVVPLLEVLVIIAVGRAIGGWPTFLLLLLESLLGAWIVRREGARTWSALRDALRSGRMPSRQLADAALVLVGGTLLLAPGFVTDAVGLFLILPATRPLTRRWLEALIARRLLGSFGRWPGGGTGAGPDGPPEVVQGEVVD